MPRLPSYRLWMWDGEFAGSISLRWQPGTRRRAALSHSANGGRVARGFVTARAGKYVYVPPDMPHLALNRSGAPCVALVAPTAADDQERIVLPELDTVVLGVRALQ